MGKKQLDLFPTPPLTPDEDLNARIAAKRAERMARDATRPGYRRFGAQRSGSPRTCPSCGQTVST